MPGKAKRRAVLGSVSGSGVDQYTWCLLCGSGAAECGRTSVSQGLVRCAPESISTRGVCVVAPEQRSADVRACCLTRRHSRDEIPESGVLSGLSGSEIDLVVQFRVVLRHLQRGPGPLKQVVHVFSGVSDRHAE